MGNRREGRGKGGEGGWSWVCLPSEKCISLNSIGAVNSKLNFIMFDVLSDNMSIAIYLECLFRGVSPYINTLSRFFRP